MDMQKG
jgi:WD40 repeat protein